VFTARVCVQGLLFATAECCKTPVELVRLYIHEAFTLLVFTVRVHGPCVRPCSRSVFTARVRVQGMLFATAECCKTPVELVRLYVPRSVD